MAGTTMGRVRPDSTRARPAWQDELAEAGSRARGAALAAARWLMVAGLALLAAGLLAALATYDPDDPALNTVGERAVTNALGVPGAWAADVLLTGLGWAGALAALWPVALALRMAFAAHPRAKRTLAGVSLAMLLAAVAFGLLVPAPAGLLDAGAGGILGLAAAKAAAAIAWPSGLDAGVMQAALGGLVATLALVAALAALRPPVAAWIAAFRTPAAEEVWDADEPADADEEDDAPQPLAETRPALVPRTAGAPAAEPRPVPKPKVRGRADPRQGAMPLEGEGALPPLDLLAPAPRAIAGDDEATLESNARRLEEVLEDYGVRGRIVGIAQGPVVTLYELEPAPGIKASRVIGLADDIARSMLAISARVAVVPGRNVIGIELPNARRETVALSEMFAHDAFRRNAGQLGIVLGKDIAGGPVVADLAPMPHLLIAGTTGSGKSVGLNAMILSLLYRLRPDECRMIMIDPKMLELSVYDDIPHLLTPVVTEPQKAVRALKWAVDQMEDRYRLMAQINVRGIAGYNERIRQAIASGEGLVKRVQTGWDEDGRPAFEEQELPLNVLPLIVVVVDELADLMMTAGKEVEYLIQRLAQKARAAGIHLIMATQRPSVDVITGVIKANLPTRISFAVTSKIDSRTILGEQGAEQLLGKGDMLYMPGGKAPVRVHGPFVSDPEVEAVADWWRAQGVPDYVAAVTEEVADAAVSDLMPATGAAPAGEDTLSQAIQVVATSRKASISYLQRQLRVGYNTAARLIEQMEQMGLVSSPDHLGRREVLMDETGARL